MGDTASFLTYDIRKLSEYSYASTPHSRFVWDRI